jgi:hypothetical protein
MPKLDSRTKKIKLQQLFERLQISVKARLDKRVTSNLSLLALMQLPKRSHVLLRRAMRLKHE